MKTYLEPSDIALMQQAAGCQRDRLLVRLLFHLGCRVSEALSIRAADVDFNKGTITILHLKKRIVLTCTMCSSRLGMKHQYCPECGEKVSEATIRDKKHHRIRTLPVDSETLDMLKESTKGHLGNEFVFGIGRHRAWQIVRDCARKANIAEVINPDTRKVRGVSPHRLRDAFAIHAVKIDDTGDGLRLLQEHLGHTSFNTTARYRKVAGEEHRAWYEKLWRDRPTQ